MSFKTWREKNRGKMLILSGGLLIAAVVMAFNNSGLRVKPTPPPPLTQLYYFDLNTGKLFSGLDTAPPIAAPSGAYQGKPAGVRAIVYACGDCQDSKNIFVGYLETLDDAFAAGVPVASRQGYYNAQVPISLPGAEEALRVSAPKPIKWVAKNSEEGAAVIEAARSHCGEDKQLDECLP